MLPLVVQPRASGNQHVDAAIIVIVCLDHIQAAGNAFQSGLFGRGCKFPVPIVAEILNLLFETHMRNHHVEMTAVGKILNDDATGPAEGDQTARSEEHTSE